jgi:hypothetical protein
MEHDCAVTSIKSAEFLRALIRLYLKEVDAEAHKYANIISVHTANILTNLNRDCIVRELLTLFQQGIWFREC